MPGRRDVAADIALYAGGGAQVWDGGGWGGGAAGLHVEPYVHSRVSLPITLAGGGSGPYGGGMGAGRIGLRWKGLSWLCIGGGFAGGFIVYDKDWETLAREEMYEELLIADLELAVGHGWTRFGFSVAARPGYEVVGRIWYFPVEVAAVMYITEAVGFTMHVFGGSLVEMGREHPDRTGWIAGGIGLVFHVAPRDD